MFEFMVTALLDGGDEVTKTVFADSEKDAVEAVFNTMEDWDRLVEIIVEKA